MAHWQLVYAASPSSETGSKQRGPEIVSQVAALRGGAKVQKAKPDLHNRAAWLRKQLGARAWNKHELYRRGGPDTKSAQKILDGFKVREDVLEKVAKALSKRHSKVDLLDIPED